MKKPFLSFKVQTCPKRGGGQLPPCPLPQGRIQELMGGGGEVKYVHVRKFHAHALWCIKGYAKLGGGKLGEA